MPAFRNAEDERRFNALRVELYMRVIKSAPPTVVSEILRNLGKLEAMLYGEGLRQGLAISQLYMMTGRSWSIPDITQLTPPAVLAAVYGDAQTPLARVEDSLMVKFSEADQERLKQLPWLSREPARFGPQTLAEAEAAYGPDLAPSDGPPTRELRKPQNASEWRAPPKKAELPLVTEDAIAEAHRRADSTPDDDVDVAMDAQLDEMIDQAQARLAEEPGEQPDIIDRVRERLREMVDDGWRPKGWADLILSLSRSMQIDAAFLDLVMGGPMGLTAIQQAGLLHIRPGVGVEVDSEGEFAGVREP